MAYRDGTGQPTRIVRDTLRRLQGYVAMAEDRYAVAATALDRPDMQRT